MSLLEQRKVEGIGAEFSYALGRFANEYASKGGADPQCVVKIENSARATEHRTSERRYVGARKVTVLHTRHIYG
jgi:hypothetical protein